MKSNTKKTLVIVESPAKAHKIQSFLGDEYVVKSTRGHILQLASGGKHGLGVNVNNNFEPKYLIMEEKVDLLQELMDIAKTAKAVILATDADREGLSISRHVYERLKDYNSNFKRVTFTEITKKAILKAIEGGEDILSSANINMYHSQTARRVLDRLVGYMASPFLFQFFGPNLSAGRVQSVLVRLIAEREDQIESFISEEYFNLHGSFLKDSKSFIAKYDAKVTKKEVAQAIQAECLKTHFVVATVEADEEVKKPSPPLITAKLQQIMSKGYKINATRTMEIAQRLYEESYITYMRTDSTNIGEEALRSARGWIKENNYDLPKSPNLYKSGNAAQEAHECIRPTDVDNTPETMTNLSPEELQVYEVIWKYFVASQMKPAIFDTLKVVIQSRENSQLKFVASGKALKYKGFLEILGVPQTGSIDIPLLKVGDEVFLYGKGVIIDRKQTQPPPRFSEAALIETLEKKAIGRPSTYATLLATITSRNYVEQNGNTFYPTELGRKITKELIQWFSFLEYDYTAKLELELDKIAEGNLDYIQMLNNFYSAFKQELSKAYTSHGAPVCEKCGGFMRAITAKNGQKFYGCQSFPKCRNTKSINNQLSA